VYKLVDTEIAYVKCFSEYAARGKVIEFWDDNVPDMYTHNYTLIKELISRDEMVEIITKEIEIRKSKNKKFLQMEIDFPIDEDIIKALPIQPQVTIVDYMVIGTDHHDTLGGNEDCDIVPAKTEEVIRDGIQVDILANTPGMGAEFAKRRINRKAEVYRTANSLDMYVCYHRGEPIGNCELFLHGSTAKIEDFDILEPYQRKGFGSSVLKHLIRQAKEHGANLVYLITDHEDTAKDMYIKCGFKLMGQKTQLHFSL
jgi:spore maturation protein CgeE